MVGPCTMIGAVFGSVASAPPAPCVFGVTRDCFATTKTLQVEQVEEHNFRRYPRDTNDNVRRVSDQSRRCGCVPLADVPTAAIGLNPCRSTSLPRTRGREFSSSNPSCAGYTP